MIHFFAEEINSDLTFNNGLFLSSKLFLARCNYLFVSHHINIRRFPFLNRTRCWELRFFFCSAFFFFEGRGGGVRSSLGKVNNCKSYPNLVPRVLRFFGQRLVVRRDTGELQFYYRRIPAVKQCNPLRSSQSKNLNKISVSRSLSWRPTAGQRA